MISSCDFKGVHCPLPTFTDPSIKVIEGDEIFDLIAPSVSDFSESFEGALNRGALLSERVSVFTDESSLMRVFTRPFFNGPVVDWDRGARNFRLNRILKDFVGPKSNGAFTKKLLDWFSPHLYLCAIPEIDPEEETKVGPKVLSHVLIPHMLRFENVYVYYGDGPDLLCATRMHCNFVAFGEDRQEKHFITFIHKASFNAWTKEVTYKAYVIAHDNLISQNEARVLWRNHPEIEVSENPFPTISAEFDQSNLHRSLELALSSFEVAIDLSTEELYELERVHPIDTQILDCTRGFIEQHEKLFTPESDEQIIQSDFISDANRITSICIDDQLSPPKEGETQAIWLRRITGNYCASYCGKRKDLFLNKLLVWICQASDAPVLLTYEDPKNQKLVNRGKGIQPAKGYLLLNPQGDFWFTVAKTNFILSNPATLKKQGGYFTIIRSLLFDPRKEVVGYKVDVVTHPHPLKIEEIDFLFKGRPEFNTKRIIFS
ncbi:MAG: hypothetical protein ACOYK9_01175 [Chlamydiia bacterium]